jgi:hypothetical protein
MRSGADLSLSNGQINVARSEASVYPTVPDIGNGSAREEKALKEIWSRSRFKL